MLKKTITYTDFNGNEASEDFFFHLSKAELVELELSHDGGLSAALQRIVAAEDGKSIIKEFKNIILSSYGQRSHDGRRFIKNQELRDEFESTEAYSALFMDLVTDAGSAAEFVQAVIPQDMAEEAAKIAAIDPRPTSLTVAETPTQVDIVHKDQLAAMTNEEKAALTDRIIEGKARIVE